MIITSIALYEHIAANPGSTISSIAQALEIRTQDVYSKLSTLESNGYLLYEDEYGRLYPFSEKELT